ncbi:Mrp/NBP35 family ATP-binding protein [Natrialbaceae archaeon AArc-T1-2]|uniref:Mrp/NBP35 family ATP-binding protein n=1 Tax=Natrialbaceae archaeon AArc-T1-2 TaxID=3053904 RepID=UPI00255AF4D1|nr:Mrp/NBP35 family ATP-binding protein [Natrialbaceae archaeon AArc-T1-2]WIV66487.1 Mrp/NBP35 family ATP-binding protein [Natrialbaceae archaeon AArc-T1-2]
MTATETQLRERLRQVEDPALGIDIVSLGLVEDLRIDDDVARITLAFNAPYATDEMQMGDRIREVAADLGLEAKLSVTVPDRESDILPGVRNVIAVSSGKGGVGKTTVATNLAAGLADAGARVGLLDGDIYGPNVPKMAGVMGEPGLKEDGTLVPPEAHGVTMISMAFLTGGGDDPAVMRGPMIDKVLMQLLDDVEWGQLDYLVVDLPPGTGDAQLTLLQSVPVTGSVIVTTPEEVALDDVRKGIEMFRDHNTPVLGIVENMSAFHCPDCGGEHALFGSGGGREVAETYDVPLLEEIPMDPEIRTKGDEGAPIVLWDTAASDAFEELAGSVANRVGAVNRADVAGVDPDDPDPEELDTPPEYGGFEELDEDDENDDDDEATAFGGLDVSDGG